MNYQIIYLILGAILGVLSRWKISLLINPTFKFLPLGTLLVNLIGAYIIGLIIQMPNISSEIRTGVIIGFLGTLTTFSSFSADTVLLILAEQYKYALLNIALNLIGSLLMTLLGIYTMIFLKFKLY